MRRRAGVLYVLGSALIGILVGLAVTRSGSAPDVVVHGNVFLMENYLTRLRRHMDEHGDFKHDSEGDTWRRVILRAYLTELLDGADVDSPDDVAAKVLSSDTPAMARSLLATCGVVVRYPHLWDIHSASDVAGFVGPGSAISESAVEWDYDSILLVSSPLRSDWLGPGSDIRYTNEAELGVQLQGLLRSGDGILVGFADGAIWRVSSDVPVGVLIDFVQVDRAHARDRYRDLGTWRRDVWLERGGSTAL